MIITCRDSVEDERRKSSQRRSVLFLQGADPSYYPPLINAGLLFAEAGWSVTFLSSPVSGNRLAMPEHRRIQVQCISERSSYIMGKWNYAEYIGAAMRLGREGFDLIYASDPLGALPGLMATSVGRSRLLYHEHDSPERESDLNSVVRHARRAALRFAELIVFPSATRAQASRREVAFDQSRLRVVWNLPRREEIPPLSLASECDRFVIYYHGSIVPDRLPKAVFEAAARFEGRIAIKVAGYETESGFGYVESLVREFGDFREGGLVSAVGPVDRSQILRMASTAHLGLALMPIKGGDINMRTMAGASNKPFDYMASGLPFLVSDLPEWREMFVVPGYALPVDPRSADSVEATLRRLIASPALRSEMSSRSRDRIARDWNYDTAFNSVLKAVQ